MDFSEIPKEISPNRDPNFKYPEKFKVPEDYDFTLPSTLAGASGTFSFARRKAAPC